MCGFMESYNGKGLEKLDVSTNPYLSFLDCHNNKLSKLNLLENKYLEFLDCSFNNLSALELSNNKHLEYLDCSSNNLSLLDLTNNKKLNVLHCRANDFLELDLSKLKKHLELVDVRSCKKLTKIILPKNKMKAVCIVHDPDFAEDEKLNICMDEGVTIVFEYK